MKYPAIPKLELRIAGVLHLGLPPFVYQSCWVAASIRPVLMPGQRTLDGLGLELPLSKHLHAGVRSNPFNVILSYSFQTLKSLYQMV